MGRQRSLETEIGGRRERPRHNCFEYSPTKQNDSTQATEQLIFCHNVIRYLIFEKTYNITEPLWRRGNASHLYRKDHAKIPSSNLGGGIIFVLFLCLSF